ncbi:MAG: ArsI/CadI family heavy metal resistance metalloenzyme [Planctomycetaceae bacterium]
MSTVSLVTIPLETLNRNASSPSAQTATRFHLSLNVSSIERIASFLQLVLGVAPAKQRSDYAKFELESPPLVLSLEQNPPSEAGSLNHLGFRFSSLADLQSAQKRVESAGIPVQREEGVECCYAKQTKFWVHDPDHRLWEFYVLEGDLEHRGGGQTLEQMVGDSAACQVASTMRPVVWEHRMGSAFAIPSTASDQIRLRGTFNVPVTDSDIVRTLHQCYQNLKPGGQIELHMLTCESPLTCAVELPGPAAYVKHVPVRQHLLQTLTEAGFADCRLTTFRSNACFQLSGQPLRETKIVAVKPRENVALECVRLVYRGPFAEVRDDRGNVWQRGIARDCPTIRWEELKSAGFETSFTVLPGTTTVGSCGT